MKSRTLALLRVSSPGIALMVILGGFLAGCRSRPSNSTPTIEFAKIPPAAQGGREKVDVISGTVSGARSGQSIVIFARSGPWWVQPWPDERALIPIQADSSWSTSTHLGFEYAALLVGPGYHPPPTMDLAPVQGGSVVAVKIVKGTGTGVLAPTVPLEFSGYQWRVRTIAADVGGVNNLFDPDNAWTDASGALHMRIKKKAGKWTCAHVMLGRSLGYGTYVLTVRDVSHLEPAVVLSMMTFDQEGGEQHYRELDVEMSRWGNADDKTNAQFGVQPFYVPGNLDRFTTPAGRLTHSLHWESGKATFKTVQEARSGAGARVVAEHVFTSGIPSPATETVMLMFYVVPSEKTPLQNDAEVVLEKFEYLP